jgi:putative hemolysin
MTEASWLAILFLLALVIHGLLAGARSAMVNSRPAALREAGQKGDRGADRAYQVASEASDLLLAFRLVQGLTRLLVYGLAFALGARATQPEIEPLVLLAVLLGAGLLVGLVEWSMENVVLRQPEAWAIRMAGPSRAVVLLARPFSRAALRLAGWVSGRRGGSTYALVTEEAIMTLVDAGEEGGAIEEEEKEMIYSIFQLSDTLAREVMVPRIDIQALDGATLVSEATRQILSTGHSRVPVFSESIDNIVGVLHVKDLLRAWQSGGQDQPIRNLAREAYFVPEAKKADDLLEELQEKLVHMAVVVDEYGGTAGVVTIEDIVEEIIGEIRDEYDRAEERAYHQVGESEFVFTGGIDVDDVNQLTGAELPKVSSETLAGFIYSQLGRIPAQGDTLRAGRLNLTVEQVVGRRIRKVRATVVRPEPAERSHETDSGSEA